jgi:hypothetical protein
MLPPFLRTASFIAAIGSLLGAALSCSGGSGTATGKDDFIAKYCAEFSPCCAKAGRPTDGAACRAVLGALAPPNYDPAAANECLTEVHAAASSPTFCDNSSNASGPSCNKVFSAAGGTLQPGEPCTQDQECAPSAEGKAACATLFKNGTEIRKCQVQIAGKPGDSPCAGTVDGNITYFNGSGTATDIPPRAYLCDVAMGVYCDSTSGGCIAIGQIGDTCSGGGSYVCVKAAYCDSTMRTCVARKVVGDSCNAFSDQCSAGNYCDEVTLKCTVTLAEGAACTSSRACASGSCVNSKCAKSGSNDFGLALLCGGN